MTSLQIDMQSFVSTNLTYYQQEMKKKKRSFLPKLRYKVLSSHRWYIN